MEFEAAGIMGAIYGDGFTSLPKAFSPSFADTLREDIETLFAEAREIEGGALPRGPERWYVEVQPERIRGFVEIATHPWFVAVCEAVLGTAYRTVEIGFDIPFPGAADQPWHRDFPMPDATRVERRVNSLAFNLTAVDTRPDMGPFRSLPGRNGTSLKAAKWACSRHRICGRAMPQKRVRPCRNVVTYRLARH